MKKAHKLFPRNTAKPMLIQAKMHPPRPGPKLVPRKRLTDKLQQGLAYKLILVHGPAGYGKTTLAAQWLPHNDTPSAWYSLGAEDNDEILFWQYLFHAVKELFPQLGQQSLDFLHSSSHTLLKTILTLFLNELNHRKEDLAIILDNFQVIHNQEIFNTLNYLLDHLPGHVHVYLVTRSIPAMPLASLRGKGELLEIGENELRFTFKESEALLNRLVKPKLNKQEISSLHQQLKGWAAGLEMTANRLNQTPDRTKYIRYFSGENHYILEFFRDELFNQAPEQVKSFLLQTAVLHKMESALCDALTGYKNSQEIIEWLEQRHYFLFPLDDDRRWYCYHPLFAEALKKLLHPQEQETICLKAAAWFKDNGYFVEAIEHALEGKHYEKAVDWIEEEIPRCFQQGSLKQLGSWIASLPAEVFYDKPKIWLYYTWVLLVSGAINKAARSFKELYSYFLNSHDKLLEAGNNPNLTPIKDELELLAGFFSVYRGDEGAVKQFADAAQTMLKNNLPAEGAVLFQTSSASLLQAPPGIWGKLQQAACFCRATEVMLEKTNTDISSFIPGYALLGEILYEQNQLEQAYCYAFQALKISPEETGLGILIPAAITASKVKMAQNQDSAALEILSTLEQRVAGRASPYWSSLLLAHQARIDICRQNAEAVRYWTKNCGLSIYDPLTSWQFYPLVTLIRALMYLELPAKALLLADRIFVQLDEECGIGQRIEVLILQALCCQALRFTGRALDCLQQALQLGAAEGYCRIFIDEGKALFKLLTELKRQQFLLPAKERQDELLKYLGSLCQGFTMENLLEDDHDPLLPDEIPQALTKREWEVLKLLAMGFSNQAIADALFISIVTVKTHVQNICRKLDVNSRAKAIARVNELNLNDWNKDHSFVTTDLI